MDQTIESLAHRALADVFEQVERVGAAARTRCRPPLYAEQTSEPLSRREAVDLLRLAQDALDYARVHLPYLRDDGRRDELVVGARVLVLDEDGPWCGTVASVDERLAVIVADDGTTTRVERDYVRPAEAAQ